MKRIIKIISVGGLSLIMASASAYWSTIKETIEFYGVKLLGPYQDQTMQQVSKQRSALQEVTKQMDHHESHGYQFVNYGVDLYGHSLEYMYARQFDEDAMIPFNGIIKAIDRNKEKIRKIQQKLSMGDEYQPEVIAQMNQLIKDNNSMADEYLSVMETLTFVLSDEDRKNMNACAHGAAIGYHLNTGSGDVSIGGMLDFENGNLVNSSLTGDEYAQVMVLCHDVFHKQYRGLLTNRGVKNGVSIPLNLTEDHMKILHDGLSQEG